jgi:hypothetical protein
MYAQCTCSHFRSRDSHAWDGLQYGACRNCRVCGKTFDEHVFVSHQFQRCPCLKFEQAA